MYVVKIKNSIKQRGKRPESEYKFIGELTPEVRKQWAKIMSHAEPGVNYEILSFQEYAESQIKNIKRDENGVMMIDRG